ncbi:MAG: DUF4199 domain-containing protein, partial [Flavobacterium sp.]
GLFISLIASTVYVIVWLLMFQFVVPDYLEKYAAAVINQMKAAGKSLSEINSQKAEMNEMIEMYNNPAFRVLMTYAEIFPVGLVVSLIAAAILKKKTSLS